MEHDGDCGRALGYGDECSAPNADPPNVAGVLLTEDEPEPFDGRLGVLLRALREERGVSQETLGVEMGHNQPFVSKVENGARKVLVSDLLEWLRALGLTVDDVSARLVACWEQGPR